MHKKTIEVVQYPMFLNNQEYLVTEADPSGFSGGSMGAANIIENKILINETMTETQKAATLIHEAMHVIACQNALDCANSEKEIAVLANGVYDMIVNNPEVMLGILSLHHDLSEFEMVEEDADGNIDEVDGQVMGMGLNTLKQ